jgi:alpha-beta hydrolase superfamily lysophospholipase
MLESEQIITDDLVTYSRKIKDSFGADVPVYLVGKSLGGTYAMITSVLTPDTYKGVTMIAPYLELYNPEAIKKYLPMAKLLNVFMPSYKLKLSPVGNVYPFNAHFFKDPLCRSLQITVHNVLLNSKLIKKVQDVYVPKFKHPLLMIECGYDQIVSNKAIRDFYERYENENKVLIEYKEVGHCPNQDNDYWPTMVKDIVEW